MPWDAQSITKWKHLLELWSSQQRYAHGCPTSHRFGSNTRKTPATNRWQHQKKQSKANQLQHQVGELIKMRVHDPRKLEERLKGPYRINQVFTNGTVLIQTKPDISTTVNIMKLELYKGQLWSLLIFNRWHYNNTAICNNQFFKKRKTWFATTNFLKSAKSE